MGLLHYRLGNCISADVSTCPLAASSAWVTSYTPYNSSFNFTFEKTRASWCFKVFSSPLQLTSHWSCYCVYFIPLVVWYGSHAVQSLGFAYAMPYVVRKMHLLNPYNYFLLCVVPFYQLGMAWCSSPQEGVFNFAYCGIAPSGVNEKTPECCSCSYFDFFSTFMLYNFAACFWSPNYDLLLLSFSNSINRCIRTILINSFSSPFTDLISSISDPEHPLSLGELAVVNLPHIKVIDNPDRNAMSHVLVEITPTITHCSLATVIGLGIRVRLEQALHPRFRLDVRIREGTHSTGDQVNKQLNDKERVAAACENESLMAVLRKMLETCKWDEA